MLRVLLRVKTLNSFGKSPFVAVLRVFYPEDIYIPLCPVSKSVLLLGGLIRLPLFTGYLPLLSAICRYFPVFFVVC